MKKSLVYFFIIIYTSSCLPSSFNQDVYKRLEQARIDSLNATLRESSIYKRVYKICANPLEFSKLQYASASAIQVTQLIVDQKEQLRTFKTKSFVSQLLQEDMQHDGFYLAMNDCNYSESQKNEFVINLLLLDGCGKIIGGVGLFKLAKILFGAVLKLKSKSMKAYYAFQAISIATILYQMKSLIHNEPLALPSEDISEKNEMEDTKLKISEKFNTNAFDQNIDSIKMSVVKKKQDRLEFLQQEISNETLTNEEVDKVHIEMNKIRVDLEVLSRI